MKNSKQSQSNSSRRKAIKVIGGGAIAGGVAKGWQKPVVDSVVIPTHAAMTAGGGEPGTGTPAPTTAPVTTFPTPGMSTTVMPPAGNASDVRLKSEVQKLDCRANGHQLYSFQYKDDASAQKYVGVMAQDLIETHPEALSNDERGYYRVNYNMLGLRMVSLEDWEDQGAESILELN